MFNILQELVTKPLCRGENHKKIYNQLGGLCLAAKHCGCGVYSKYPFGEFLNSSKKKRKLQSLLFSENEKFKSH